VHAGSKWSSELYSFQQATLSWTLLNTVNSPSARWGMGFASASNGNIYLFGGYGYNGFGGDLEVFIE
jgi:hypothetical protein